MLSNQADYNQSDQDTEAEYTAVINLSGDNLAWVIERVDNAIHWSG